MENIQRNSIIIGALLHDIGKFWQRAEPERSLEKSHFLSPKARDVIIGDICPNVLRDGYSHPTRQHAAWTYQFIIDHESVINAFSASGEDSILNLAANHHRPATTLQKIIRLADCISAGSDRTEADKDVKDELDRSFNYRKQLLRPVFESIFPKDYPGGQKYRYDLTALVPDENVFPRELTEKEDFDRNADYRALWDSFIEEFNVLPNGNFTAFFESLLALLQKYTWRIPSSTIDNPDISLYDHLRTTAAIAVTIFDYIAGDSPSNDKAQLPSLKNDDRKFAQLICGDISGIQKFIYQISSVKAATSLKGRSFTLQMICDAAARYYLSELNLPLCNLIYSSGGNFYILVPNTDSTERNISSIQKTLNQKLLDGYRGEIALCIGSVALSVNDMVYSLAEKWQEAIKDASKAKRRRFSDSIQSNEKFFQPVSKADAYPCDNCGSDIEKKELKAIKKGEGEKYCLSCHKFINTGNKLKSADILIEFIHQDSYNADEKIIYPIDGIPVGYILTNKDGLDYDAGLVHQASYKKIYYLNQTDFLKDLTGERFTAYARGFKFYGGNHLPLNDKGEPATFDYLAGARENKAEETIGYKRLGVLRMDVDNLGLIFQRGFLYNKLMDGAPIPTPTYSISRLTTLSSLLDFFFCGYLNTLHQRPEFKDYLYILYSGGDDLFIVGRWDKAIDFAALIREEFKKFTCQHPDISITGGVALTPPKYPIHRSAELAGDAESQAKFLKRNVNGKKTEKDAFCFLGKTLSWNDFLVAKALKDDLCHWINRSEGKEKMNRGLLTRLTQIYETYQKEAKIINEQKTLSEQDRAEMIQFNKWRWRLVYSLNRFKKQNKEFEHEIESIQNALITSNSYKGLLSDKPIIEYLDVPVQWAEFTLRTNKKEDVL